MPPIICPDCKKETSSKASTCPGCAAPIITSNAAAGSVVERSSTFQEPSESLELHAMGLVVMLIIGIVWIMLLIALAFSMCSPRGFYRFLGVAINTDRGHMTWASIARNDYPLR